jgi:hypothetical protein
MSRYCSYFLTKLNFFTKVVQILKPTKFIDIYLFVSLSDGRTIWIDTLDKSASLAWVNTGVVIGIFSVVEFFPNIYLYRRIFNMNELSEQINYSFIWRINSYPATSLKPVFPDSLSPLVSTTTNGSYCLTCCALKKQWIHYIFDKTRVMMMMNEKIDLIICRLFQYLIFRWFQFWCLVNPQLQNVKFHNKNSMNYGKWQKNCLIHISSRTVPV